MVFRSFLYPVQNPIGRSLHCLVKSRVNTLLPRRRTLDGATIVSSYWFSTRSRYQYQQSTASLLPSTVLTTHDHIPLAELHALSCTGNSSHSFLTLVEQGHYAQALDLIQDNIHAATPEDRQLFFETIAKRLGADELYALFRPVLAQQQHSNSVKRIGRSAARFWSREQVIGMMRLCQDPSDERFQVYLYRRLTMAYHRTRDLDALLEGLELGGVSSRLYNMALHACVRSNELDHAEEILKRMEQQDIRWDAVSFTIFMRSQLAKGRLDEATQCFDGMISNGITPTAPTYHLFIKYLVQNGQWRDVVKWLDRMGNMQNAITLRILLREARRHKNRPGMATALERVLKTVAPQPIEDENNVGIAASTLLRHKRTQSAIQLLETFLRQRHASVPSDQQPKRPPSVRIYNMYMQALCQQGDLYEAERVFDTLTNIPAFPSPDVFSYTILIQGYIKQASSSDTSKAIFDLYRKMPSRGGPTTRGTLQGMLLEATIKTHSGDIGHIRDLFDQMVKDVEDDDTLCPSMNDQPVFSPPYRKGVYQSTLYKQTRRHTLTILYNTMMEGYFVYDRERRLRTGGSSGLASLKDALQLLDDAVRKDVKLNARTLNIWVRGLARWHRDLEAAKTMIQQFHKLGIEPDERTTWHLVFAAYRQYDLEQARQWLQAYEDRGLPITYPLLAELKQRIM
ncbi:hypothetical protein LRAMOSA08504 [Lichtheimia ramosa]|uniref:Pentacotripeptide-repeat region of PRORP domain-containing protein n=1 Tax=Lichtheimia ramosa TaxID=688394 RepID=A0A077WEE0_9FUNG|nr:hypothetical protein LRAMOSA08504 [Lichtheimia ramosa]